MATNASHERSFDHINASGLITMIQRNSGSSLAMTSGVALPCREEGRTDRAAVLKGAETNVGQPAVLAPQA